MNEIKFTDFANTKFKLFSMYDCQRSIANVIDGLKITQRKSIHGNLQRGENAPEIKVAQLAPLVAFHTSYHHGEAGIAGVICNMAQKFPGANNVNLFEPIGQFGSRLDPQPAAARYIFTKFSKEFRKYFKKEDDCILNYLEEDGDKIEPDFYLPLIPMVLVNGSQGIGTGFASKVFNYNPIDLKNDILNILKDKKRKPLLPWYDSWNGTVEAGENPGQYYFKGDLEVVNTTTIKITELPIGVYQEDMKKVLIKLSEEDFIKDFDDDSTKDGIDITVTVPRATAYLEKDKLMEKFKLISKDTENLTLWLPTGKLRCFNNVKEIVDYFVEFRLAKYEERRLKLIDMNEAELKWLEEKIKFIEFYLAESDTFRKSSKAQLMQFMSDNGFTQSDRLLSQRIYSLTRDEIEELKADIKNLKAKVKALKNTTAEDMYILELEELKI